MEEETKDKSESPQDNQSENEDNRLPYEPPKLRKHGKVNDTTLTSFASSFPQDNPFFPLTDFSFTLL